MSRFLILDTRFWILDNWISTFVLVRPCSSQVGIKKDKNPAINGRAKQYKFLLVSKKEEFSIQIED